MTRKLVEYVETVRPVAERALAAATREDGVGKESGEGLALREALPAVRLLLDRVDGGAEGAGMSDAQETDAQTVEAFIASMRRMAAVLGELTEPAHVVRDGAGHARPIYVPLMVHLHVAAFRARYESLSEGAWSRCEELLPRATQPIRWLDGMAGEAAKQPDVALWLALCAWEYGKAMSRDVDIELAEGIVGEVIAAEGEGGSLHAMGPSESLDGWTYTELCGLHALANLALVARRRDWSAAVERVALYHLENSQPDNTTNQPWAVFAFAWSDRTRSFADQQLHDVTTHLSSPGEGGAASGAAVLPGLLLADAVGMLGEFRGTGRETG